jgi:hypothetical protein
MYEVRASHTYAAPGNYLLRVNADGPLGATDTADGIVAVYAPGTTLRAVGQNVTFKGATFTSKPLATFTDTISGTAPSSYEATVDWGDGAKTVGTIKQTGLRQFAVFGTHKYVDAEEFSVAVRVSRKSPAASSLAWSRVVMTGFTPPRHLPPFAKANLTSFWNSQVSVNGAVISGLPTKKVSGRDTTISGYLYLFNSGAKPTGPWKLRFYLSTDTTLNTTGPNPDRLLTIGTSLTELALNPLASGAGGTLAIAASATSDLSLKLPTGDSGAGRYLLTQLVYSDPITDHMAVPKVVVSDRLQGIVVNPANTAESPLLVREGDTNNPLRQKTFTVRLDMPASSPVTIPMEVLDASGVVDDTEITLSSASIVIPAGSIAPVTVTVTSKDDPTKDGNITNYIHLKPATSTDTRFNGLEYGYVRVLNLDDNDTTPATP